MAQVIVFCGLSSASLSVSSFLHFYFLHTEPILNENQPCHKSFKCGWNADVFNPCSNGVIVNVVKIHWRHSKIVFSKTTRPIWTKLGTKFLITMGVYIWSNKGVRFLVKEIQTTCICWNEGHILFFKENYPGS